MRLPEVIEELWVKPLIWLVPLFWWNLSLQDRLIMFGTRRTYSILLGILMGGIYYWLIKGLDVQFGKWTLSLIGIAMATSITEELTFSGFVAGYLNKMKTRKGLSFLIIGIMVAIIRLPILLFVHRLGLTEIVGVMLLAGASGVMNAWIRIETGNVVGAVLARMGMNLAVLV